MSLFAKKKAVSSTGFSSFIRDASAAEKKKVYTDVLKRAVERQHAIRIKVSARTTRTK